MFQLKASVSGRADRFLTRHFSGGTMDYKQIFSLIFPLFIDQAFIVCMNLFNTSMISSSGLDAVSAVSMVDSVNTFLMYIFVAVATGGTIIVAQLKGRGSLKEVPRAISGSVTAVLILAATISVAVVVAAPLLLDWIFGKAEAAVIENAKIYLIGCAVSYVFFAMMESVSAVLRGLGETRSSLVLTLVMNGLYVMLNFFLINVFDLGIVGMVISLISARMIAALVSVFFLIRKRNPYRLQITKIFCLDLSIIRHSFKLGMPFAAEQMFFNGGKILTQTFIVGMGTLALATNAITSSVVALFMIPANTFSLSIITIVGQCIGRKDLDQARRMIRSFMVLTSLSYVFLGLILLPFLPGIVSIFGPTQSILEDIYQIIYINTIAQAILWAPSFLVPSALRAGGDARFTSVVSMLSMWLFRVVLGYLLGVVLGWGVPGIWFAMEAEWGVRGFVFMIRLKGQRWYSHKVIG